MWWQPQTCRTRVLTELDKCEAELTILRAAKELIEAQEAEIEELKRRVGTYRISLLALAHLKT